MRSDVDGQVPRAFRALRVLTLLIWMLGTFALLDHLLLYPVEVGTGPNRDFVVELSAKPDLQEVAEILSKHQVVTDKAKWLRMMRLLQSECCLRSGWVALNRALSPLALMPRVIVGRGSSNVTLNIPEGFTRFDAATRLARFGVAQRPDFLAATVRASFLARLNIEAPSVEGYLFPATYTFEQGSGGEAVVSRMVTAFRNQTRAAFNRLAESRSSQRLPLTDHETLILASIVEREAQRAEERPIIAGVFVNRLADPTFRPHRLQADPTVAYGCLAEPDSAPTCSAFDGRHITPAMVRDPQNPYNTYRIEGLPPGPISNPGLASIEAAIAPMSHDYFYFVATGGGRHSFSRTLDEHNARIHGTP